MGSRSSTRKMLGTSFRSPHYYSHTWAALASRTNFLHQYLMTPIPNHPCICRPAAVIPRACIAANDAPLPFSLSTVTCTTQSTTHPPALRPPACALALRAPRHLCWVPQHGYRSTGFAVRVSWLCTAVPVYVCGPAASAHGAPHTSPMAATNAAPCRASGAWTCTACSPACMCCAALGTPRRRRR